MTFLETLLVLLLAAILLLQVSRRLGLPYPAMLALAGVVVAFIPGAPTIRIDPATALLLFSAALTVQSTGGLTAGVALRLAAAAPGGVLLGIAVGLVMRRVGRLVSGTLGGSILQFVNTFLVWVVAEHLGLSAVLAVVACAMTIAHATDAGGSPRMRVHSYAVWATVVFLLNVLAFLLMGLQAHAIVAQLTPHRFREALVVVALVFATLVTVRFAAVMAWHLLATRFPRLRGDLPAPSFRQGVAVSWSGMRGLLTLATAFALPGDFPQRDLVVLTAFGVVLATLVVQGLTLTPLIRLLGLDQGEDPEREVADGRRALMEAALARLDGEDDKEAEELRDLYGLRSRGADDREAAARLDRRRRHALALVDAERDTLEKLRDGEKIGPDTYYLLQEEIDWRELTLLPEQERRIDEA